MRLLHQHPAYGYTTNPHMAARGEPEALTAAELDDLALRTHRRTRDQQLRQWRQERARIEASLDRLYAMRTTHDVTTPLRALQRQLDRLDNHYQR